MGKLGDSLEWLLPLGGMVSNYRVKRVIGVGKLGVKKLYAKLSTVVLRREYV